MPQNIYPFPSNAAPEIGIMDQQRMLNMLLDNLDGMVYRCRNDSEWTMEFVSEGCLRLTGYASSDLLHNAQTSFEQVTHPDDRDYVRDCIQTAVAQRARFELEYRILRADGSTRWVWERGTGVFDAQGELQYIEGFISDVTERRSMEDAARDAERRYRSIFEHATEGIFQSSLDGRYLNVNPALARLYGFDSPESLIEELDNIERQLYIEPNRRAEFVDLMREHGAVTNFESAVRRRDGSIIWISENAHAVRDAEHEILYFEGTVTDITSRRRYQQALAYQATHDMLTGLPNRALFMDRLEQSLASARREGRLVTVAFIDLDQFKLINDTLGHATGDALLMTIARRLRDSLRNADTLARLGGDEFVLTCTHPADREEISRVMQRVLDCISQPWNTLNGEYNIGCSIGVSVFPRDGGTAEELLKNADTAMYKAKEAGRNCFRFFTPELNQRANERLELENGLRRALARGEFQLHYQPRIDLATTRIVGLEALIRWRVPGQGMVSPGRFIPVAEDTGLILPIGEWVLRTACAQAASMRSETPVMISVNISPRQFNDDRFATTLETILRETGLDPSRLELEVTESVMMQDVERTAAMLDQINKLGVEIAIDDFGTGYSSLAHLKRFPVDRLKIDQSFVRDLAKNPNDAFIVQAILSLGRALGLRVVAEGVETAEQLAFLRKHHCDEVQGFYFGMPAPAQDYPDFFPPL